MRTRQANTRCTAVGNGANGVVIITSNGGSSWTRTSYGAGAVLSSVSCIPGTKKPTCFAAGDASDGGPGVTGSSVVIESASGSSHWQVKQTFPYAYGFPVTSISCVDARHCWTAWSGSYQVLNGMSNGGASWTTVTSDAQTAFGGVACLNDKVCVATTDGGLYVTTDDGGPAG
ncbi:MAG TPA: hypothetical protein VGG16_24695 [Streptosporangiaceae bacterium]|jgi:hypothetical protein